MRIDGEPRKKILDSLERFYGETYNKSPPTITGVFGFDHSEIYSYGARGLAQARCIIPDARTSALRVEDLVVDTEVFQSHEKPPRHAWFSKIRPDLIGVMVSSGGPPEDKKYHIELDPERTLEGLEVRFFYKERLSHQTPFTVSLIPLYNHDL